MSQADAGIRGYFEKKKSEKNVLVPGKTPQSTSQSFMRHDNASEVRDIREEIPEHEDDSHFSAPKKPIPPLDESKSIKDFFSSKIQTKDHSEDDHTKKTQKMTKKPGSSVAHRRASPSKPNNYSKLGDREKESLYLDVYDENLQLKKKEETLECHIKTLNTKLQVIESQFNAIRRSKDPEDKPDKDNLNSVVELKSENQRLKEKLKALSQAKAIVKAKPPGKSKKIYTAVSAPNDERLGESVRMIELLKRRLKDSESQLKNMQEVMQKSSFHPGGTMGQSDIHSKNIKLASLQTRYDELLATIESQRAQYEGSKKRLEDLNEQLFREREENNRLKKEIRGMELSVDHIKDVEAKVKELEDEKRNLNMRLKDLCESPFIKQHEEKANLQTQVRKLEADLQKYTLENKSLNELYIKSNAEYERTKKTLDETNHELKQKIEQAAELKASLEMKDKQLGPFKDLDREDDAFLKALGMVKWQGEEPSWYKLDFLERPQKLDIKDADSLLKEIERLRLEKGELAAQLERSQTLLKIQMETEQEQNRIHQAQIATLELQLKGAILRSNELSKLVDLKGFGSHEGVEVYEKNGTKYDDRVSVFSDDASEAETEPGTNYFEIWLGDAELDENTIKQLMKANKDVVFDIKRVLTFLIVDFYNHDSQHSSIAEGTHTNFNFQMSFKVLCDEIFLNFLENGYVKLELYVSEGMETAPIARANIPLKELVKKHLGEGIAPAFNSQITFFGAKNEIVGLMNFRMRMRSPIGESLKWMKEKRELGIIEEEVAHLDENVKRKRKLVIIIDKAVGLSKTFNTFVAYTLDGRDYHTSPQPGKDPKWDYTGIHEVDYDENFVSYLKTNVIEFMLVDDNVPLVAAANINNEYNDLIGFGRLSINGLITNEIIDSIIPIHGSKNEKRGTLHIKIFWHEGTLPKKPMPEESLISKSWEQELVLRISAALRAKQLNVESAFMIFDVDRDKVVNIHDFQTTLLGTLNLQINKDEIELLYQKMPIPLTRENFIAVFGQHIPSAGTSGRPDISKLNLMLQNNTTQLSSYNLQVENTKKLIGQKISERVKQTTQIGVFKELDSNGDGLISILELKTYFLRLGLKLSDDEVLAFVKAVDLDRNNKIDVKEFLTFILSGFTISSIDRNLEIGTSEYQLQDQTDYMISSRSGSPRKKVENLVTKMMDQILSYMKNNKLTFLKLYERIDQNHDNFLSKNELNDFLKKIGLNVTLQESNALLSHLDENKDNKISIKEFVDNIKDYSSNRHLYSLYDDEYQEVPIETLNEKIVEYISQYLVSSKQSIADFFNSIDKNNDGIISREELNLLFIKTLKITLSRDEESTFFNFLDKNRDNRISIPEFNNIMKPFVEKAMNKGGGQKIMTSSNMSSKFSYKDVTTPYSQEFLNNLQNKVYDVLTKYQVSLKASFQLKRSENKGFVSREDFKDTLLEIKPEGANEFNIKEINAIIDQMCEKSGTNVNYEKFLVLQRGKLKKTTNFSLPNEGSSRDLIKSKNLAKEIFGKISKVVKENKINMMDAFKTFDFDGDGTIDVEEFKKAFDGMRLDYTKEDVEEIMAVIGVGGKVDYKKFMGALNLK